MSSPVQCRALSADVSPHEMCCRLGSGAFVSGKLADFKNRPKEPIILYEFDACPFCRKVGLSTSCCIRTRGCQLYWYSLPFSFLPPALHSPWQG